jgi:hypothetical protein
LRHLGSEPANRISRLGPLPRRPHERIVGIDIGQQPLQPGDLLAVIVLHTFPVFLIEPRLDDDDFGGQSGGVIEFSGTTWGRLILPVSGGEDVKRARYLMPLRRARPRTCVFGLRISVPPSFLARADQVTE